MNFAGSILDLARIYVRDGAKFILLHGRNIPSRITKPLDFFIGGGGGFCNCCDYPAESSKPGLFILCICNVPR